MRNTGIRKYSTAPSNALSSGFQKCISAADVATRAANEAAYVNLLVVRAAASTVFFVTHQYVMPTAIPSSGSINSPTYTERAPGIGQMHSISVMHCITAHARIPGNKKARRVERGPPSSRICPPRQYRPVPRVAFTAIILNPVLVHRSFNPKTMLLTERCIPRSFRCTILSSLGLTTTRLSLLITCIGSLPSPGVAEGSVLTDLGYTPALEASPLLDALGFEICDRAALSREVSRLSPIGSGVMGSTSSPCCGGLTSSVPLFSGSCMLGTAASATSFVSLLLPLSMMYCSQSGHVEDMTTGEQDGGSQLSTQSFRSDCECVTFKLGTIA